MATPSSSGTSPSPALSFTLPTSASENSTDEPNDIEQAEREEWRKKLLARTEFAKITRALRTTLALASYKTRHNVANIPLRSLEAQVAQRSNNANNAPTGQANLPMFPASFGNDKKRKASSTANNTNFYSSPLSQGVNAYGLGFGSNTPSSNMGMASTHSSYNFPPPSPSTASGPTHPSKSLFASILSLPPAKRARTIHNPEAPPVPPPLPPPQPQSRRSPKKGAKKGKEPAVSSKGRPADRKGKGKEREKKTVAGRARANSISSVHTHSSFSADTEIVNDTDMKAAETLTDLLFSRTGGTASPRSSFSAPTSASRTAPSGPIVGALPLSQSPSGSSIATQTRSHVRTASNASTASGGTNIIDRDQHASSTDSKADTRRSATPTATPRLATRAGGSSGQSLSAQATYVFGAPAAAGQRAADSEAADLMLLLANSPSPARPTAPRDQDITRNAYAAGRVLFPSGLPANGQSDEREMRSLKTAAGEDSISSIESIEGIRENGRNVGSDDEATTPPSSHADISPPQVPRTAVGPPTPDDSDANETPLGSRSSASASSHGQLLPSPPSPSLTHTGPLTPSSSAFRLTDYINMTPSPAPAGPGSNSSSTLAPSTSHSQLFPSSMTSGSSGRLGSSVSVSSPLRKSFDRDAIAHGVPGRKLFENETGAAAANGSNGAGRKIRFGEGVDGAGTLGSGIDLVQT